MKITIKKPQIIKFILLLIYILYFTYLGGANTNVVALRYPLFAIIIGISYCRGGIKKSILTKICDIDILWILLLLSSFFASLINGGSLSEIINFLLIYLCYILIIPRDKSLELKHICIAVVISALILGISSLATTPFAMYLYRGLFYNSNAMGIVMSAPVVAAIYLYFISNMRIKKIIYAGSVFFFILLIFASSCRSALLSCALALLGFVMIYIWSVSQEKNRKRYIFFICGILSIVIYLLVERKEILVIIGNVVFKYGTSTELSSSRIGMWKQVIEDSTLFGTGEVAIHCHNDVLIWLQKYGWISAIILSLLLSCCFVKALKNFWLCRDEKSACELGFIVVALTICMVEEVLGIMGRPCVVLMFIMMGRLREKRLERRALDG